MYNAGKTPEELRGSARECDPQSRTPLADVFYALIPEKVRGVPDFSTLQPDTKVTIRCRYCGFEATADCIEAAGTEFYEHMFFGINTSPEHFAYAAGTAKGGAK